MLALTSFDSVLKQANDSPEMGLPYVSMFEESFGR